MPDQPTITLNDGHAIPQLGFGTWRIAQDRAEAAVGSALGLGYTHVDTAMIYRNEEGVGAAVRASDATVFVTTKLWNPDQGFDATLRAFDASFDRLGLDWIDLYLIHWPMPARELYVESWKAMVRLREEGRVKSIGVSNFRETELERIIDHTGVVPAVNQVELHPGFQQQALRAFHAENDIATESWSPLGQGKELADPALGDVASRLGRTPAQVVIRWHLQSGLIVIPKASTRERQAENLAALDFTLSDEDMARIDALDRADGRLDDDPADVNE